MSHTLRTVYFIDNGMNSPDRVIARFSYAFKKRLPAKMGGLPGNVTIWNYPRMEDVFFDNKDGGGIAETFRIDDFIRRGHS